MYGRGTQGIGFGPPVTPPIIKQLLIANVLVYLAQSIFGRDVVLSNGLRISTDIYFGGIVPALVWTHGYLWQPFTYMWLHGSLMHILMNCLMLWMFGSTLAMAWGPKRFLQYYLLCGVGAGLIISLYPMLTVHVFGIESALRLQIPTVGASGAFYGVLLAFSLTWPDRTIAMIFPPVAFRAIWLIPILFLMSMYMDMGRGNISHIGHLGGVLVGWFYMQRQGRAGNPFSMKALQYRWRRWRMRRNLRAVRVEEYEKRRKQQQRRNDRTFH